VARRLTLPLCLVAASLAACYEHDPGPPTGFAHLGDDCLETSWCEEPLRCEYDQCRSPCELARDCPAPPATCVPGLVDSGVRVCTLARESTCDGDLDCPLGLYCGVDDGCHEPCGPSAGGETVECAGGYLCSGTDSLCYETDARE